MPKKRGYLNASDYAVWRFVWEQHQARAASPTMSEIARAVHLSSPAVRACLDKLEMRGFIRCNYLGYRRAARSILHVQEPTAQTTYAEDYTPT